MANAARVIRTAYLFTFLSAMAAAQTAGVGDNLGTAARQLMQSARLQDKAWGAYLGSRIHDASVHAAVINELRGAPALATSEMDSENFWYVQSLFDSLIESGEAAPAEVILPFASRWRPETLILLARDKGTSNERALMSMLPERMGDVEWVAVSNLLFAMRSKAFLRKTLEEIEITHTFDVQDAPMGRGVASKCGIGALEPKRTLPAGFPPLTVYKLRTAAEAGLAVAVPGPHPVYYQRIAVPANSQQAWDSMAEFIDKQEIRLEYMAGLVGGSVREMRRDFEPSSVIEWQGVVAFQRAVSANLDAQAAAIREFVEQAKSQGLEEAAGLHLRIVSNVNDLVGAAHDPLPQIQTREFVIQ